MIDGDSEERTTDRSAESGAAGEESTDRSAETDRLPISDQPPNTDQSAGSERVRELAREARAARESFEPSAAPDEDRALEILREGVGPVIWVYVEGRTGGRAARYSQTDMRLLRQALNDWLELYARCYGVELDAEFTVREAAELLVETRNVRDTARVLTRVPER